MKYIRREKATVEKQENTKIKRNRDYWILIPVYLLLTGILLFVLGVSMMKPQNNLIAWQMMVGTGIAIAAFLGSMILWDKLYPRLPKGRWTFAVALLTYGLFLFVFCLLQGDRSNTLADYSAIHQSALEISQGEELSFPRYFTIYANNVKPALFLSVIFRIGNFLHVKSFYLALILNILKVLASIWAVNVLAMDEDGTKWSTWFIVLTAICIPAYVLTGVFYTDSMSFGYGVMALALLKVGAREQGQKGSGAPMQNGILKRLSTRRELFCAMAAGILAVIGAEWKMTACIPLVAGFCTLLVKKEWRRVHLLMTFFITCILMVIAIALWSNQYEFARESKKTANPLSSWFAIGMKGDGSWNESKVFVDQLNLLKNKAQKEEMTKAYIREHLGEAFSAEHLFRKTRRNYASGMLGSQDFLSNEDDGTVTWQLMAPWGKHYWRTAQIMFCYMGMIYGIMLLGCVKTLTRLFQGEEIPAWKMVADVSFLGMFLFLLIWESNNRQLYNQLPILLLGLILNGRYLIIERKRRK